MEKTNVKYGAYVQILKEELLPAKNKKDSGRNPFCLCNNMLDSL